MTELKFQTTIGLNESQKLHRPLVFPKHPECPDRIFKALDRLEKTKVLDACQVVKDYPKITINELSTFHSSKYLETLSSLSNLPQEEINQIAKNFDSVQLCQESFQAAIDSISCCGYLAQLVAEGKVRNAFALVRPPGHHAMHDAANGFCLLNNEVYAAKRALESGVEKVLIVDFDVHHGQGIQRAFYNDPRVTYFSTHRYEHGLYWPNLEESNFHFIGEGHGKGHNINVPINESHAKNSDFNFIFWNILFPIAQELKPDMIIFFMGFDSCLGDPLGEFDLDPRIFQHWIYHLAPLCKGKILLTMGGGYHHVMLAIGVEKLTRTLLGELPEQVDLSDLLKESTISTCLDVISVLKDHWKSLDWISKKIAEHKVEVKFLKAKPEDIQNTEDVEQEKLIEVPKELSKIVPFVKK